MEGKKKVAIISGANGQDASYLAEFLLGKNYEVYGLIRHVALKDQKDRTGRINHLEDKIKLLECDITSAPTVFKVINDIKPDEFYHLAAQSFVKTSFEDPAATYNTNFIGTTNILEALRTLKPDCKFYFAGTSEMFGKVLETPQKETTPFNPRSPYGVAKVASFFATKNYREAYNMFTCSGILFNHESVPKNSAIIIKDENGQIDIMPIEDIFKCDSHKYEKPAIKDEYVGRYVWNGESWTKILNGTCYYDKKKEMKIIQTRESSYEATNDHVSFNEKNEEISTKDWKIGDSVFKIKYPDQIKILENDKNLAYFIGWIVGDGYISKEGKIRLTGIDKKELLKIVDIIKKMYGWTFRISSYGPGNYDNCKKDIFFIDINNDRLWGQWLRKQIYTLNSFEKRIPKFILNSIPEVKKAFFDGYYLADGRKNGHEVYEYKGFTTSSQTLCLGLNFIFKSFSNQTIKTKNEYRDNRRYYYVQFGTPDKIGKKGDHLMKKMNEIINITNSESEDGWFYDIQTESQTFATGPNLFKIHNSPRRGREFVTQKIVMDLNEVSKGKKECLELGNMEAKRDWGFSGDYVRAMWMMLQQDKPDDYVISTEETHTVREFVEVAARRFGYDIEWSGKGVNEVGSDRSTGKTIVRINPDFYRPAEVDLLIGDSTKARTVLGWKPEYKFKQLVEMMVDAAR